MAVNLMTIVQSLKSNLILEDKIMEIRESMRKKNEFFIYTTMWITAIIILMVLLVQNLGDARIVNYSGIVRGATPVSYTHLDVYKRQAVCKRKLRFGDCGKCDFVRADCAHHLSGQFLCF